MLVWLSAAALAVHECQAASSSTGAYAGLAGEEVCLLASAGSG